MIDWNNPCLVDNHNNSRIEINTNPFTLGRGLGCNYIIPNTAISRLHCQLQKNTDNSWILIDKSTNGTYINNKLIKQAKSPPLNNGDTIMLDNGTLIYSFELPLCGPMDDISDEQLCLFADTVLDNVEMFQQDRGQDGIPAHAPASPGDPLYEHFNMTATVENQPVLNEADKTAVPVASSTSEVQPGPSSLKDEKPPDGGTSGKSREEQMQDNYEVMENELQCAICSELFVKATTLNCSHTFCRHCIELWKKNKSECPICRTNVASMTATLVLDNVIAKVVETSSAEIRQHRKQLLEERERLAKAKEPPAQDVGQGRRGRRGGRRGRGGGSRQDNPAAAVGGGAAAQPVIEVSSESDSDSDDHSSEDTNSDYTSDWQDSYADDDWYDNYDDGVPGAYYGGYGHCYSCGARGHWANGCPYR
ncbi:hypothetical protein NQ317_004617 [Molorchus minor]|uniref:E3 ubiquitin-protein ligase CHFR n=1 Tax=Molorchus minor TaxID=1323400 RepID=A0ABQ9J587_9CUCU|nr:hypothetical protein NQ317_004617 [Molorchus minor]